MIQDSRFELPLAGQLLAILALASLFPAYFMELTVLFAAAIFILASIYLAKFYYSVVIKQLDVKLLDRKNLINNGELTEITIEVNNNSRLPIGYAEILISIDPYISLPDFKKGMENAYLIPVSLSPKKKIRIPVTVKGEKRGYARLRVEGIHFYDPFRITRQASNLINVIPTHIAVLPEQKSLNETSIRTLNADGDLTARWSLYEDFLQPNGVRHYQLNDSFKRIHWKASAKTGEMMTKTFEKKARLVMTIVLCYDASVHRTIPSKRLEKHLSYAAYLCHYAHKHSIDIELFCNTKPFGEILMHLPAGTDQKRTHLFKCLEFFSLIQNAQIKVKPWVALKEIDKRITGPRLMVFMGNTETDEMLAPMFRKWERQNHRLLKLNEEAEGLEPMTRGTGYGISS